MLAVPTEKILPTYAGIKSHGDVDPLVPLACGIDTAEAVPGARLCVVEGMGHALPITMWPQIVDAIAAHANQDR